MKVNMKFPLNCLFIKLYNGLETKRFNQRHQQQLFVSPKLQNMIVFGPLALPLRPVRISAVWFLPSSTLCGQLCFWSAGRGERQSWLTGGALWTPPPSP